MNLPDFHQMSRREIEDFLIEKSLVDPAFRSHLISDPAGALRSLGLPVGEKVKINVLVEEPSTFSIVIPRVLADSDELNPEDLEAVSGGASPFYEFFHGYV